MTSDEMNRCPEVDALIALAGDQALSVRLAEHVATCERCSQDLSILRLTRHAFVDVEPAPKALVRRVMTEIGPSETPVPATSRDVWMHGVGSFVLATLTVVVGVELAVGSTGGPAGLGLLFFSGAIGLAAALLEPRVLAVPD